MLLKKQLTQLKKYYKIFMKTVCVCGSKRFREEISIFCDKLENSGVVVFRPNINEPLYENQSVGSPHTTRMIFKGLTLEHFDMIRKADVCFVYNKDSYVGISVTLEIGFANALGKIIYSLEKSTDDPCRDSIIDDVIFSAEDLVKKL